MDRNLYKDNFIRDISIEEFDHITDGVADHVFSDEYLAGKESIMRKENGTKISKLGIKIAAAAAAVVCPQGRYRRTAASCRPGISLPY